MEGSPYCFSLSRGHLKFSFCQADAPQSRIPHLDLASVTPAQPGCSRGMLAALLETTVHNSTLILAPLGMLPSRILHLS